jgi:hypothetical protein
LNEFAAPDLEGSPAAAVAGGVLVLGSLVVLAWLAFRAPAPQAYAVERAVVLSTPSSPYPAPALVFPAQTTLSKPTEPVCDTGSSHDPEPLSAARARIERAMELEDNALARASALVLRSSGGQVIADTPLECEGAQCPSTPEVVESKAAALARIAANRAPRDALARMALLTRSAQVYALAWQLCQAHGAQDSTSACQMLSSAQWARLDDRNAAAWLAVAAQARERMDSAAEMQALFRLTHASNFNSHWGAVAQQVLKHAPQQLSAAQALAIHAELQRLERNTLAQSRQIVLQHCALEAQKDSNRQQECATIAIMMAAHARSLAELKTAINLGELGALPAPQLQTLNQEYTALSDALERQAQHSASAPTECVAWVRQLQHAQVLAEHGELKLAREYIAGAPH